MRVQFLSGFHFSSVGPFSPCGSFSGPLPYETPFPGVRCLGSLAGKRVFSSLRSVTYGSMAQDPYPSKSQERNAFLFSLPSIGNYPVMGTFPNLRGQHNGSLVIFVPPSYLREVQNALSGQHTGRVFLRGGVPCSFSLGDESDWSPLTGIILRGV